MIGHEMVVVNTLDAGSERLPHLWVDIALDIATHHPDDIRRILIAVGKELSVCLSLLCIDILCLYLRTPDGYHADVDAVLFGKFDDVVEMIPITVNTSGVSLRQIPTGRERLLSVDIKRRCAVHHLDENGIKSRYTAFLKIILCLGSIQTFRKKPAGITQHEKRLSVFKLQESLVGRNL